MDKVEALIVDCTTSINKYCNAKLFERLPNLRLIKLVDVYDIKGNFKASFDELRYISWHDCPWTHLPYGVHLQKLVVLDMPFSRFETLWKIAKLPSLRHLNLEGCKYLKALPHSIGRLTALYHLNLNDCVNLKRLPKPITQLTTLSSLNMRKCSNLKLLPEQLGDLKCLKMLDVSLTAIEQLPDSIAHLKKLVELNLWGCEKLRKLPEQFGNMEALEKLNAGGSAIEQLPDSFSNLLKLRALNLSYCSELKRLPEQLGKMQCLESLYAFNTEIEELPDSIGLLPRIQVLNFGACKKLRKLPEQFGNMEALETFDAAGSAIEQLPDSFSNLRKLRSLNLRGCSELKRLPEQLGKMRCLERLEASGTAIEELPDSIASEQLGIHALNFGGHRKLTYVPNSICNLKSLENLYLTTHEDIIKIELIEAVNDMKLEDLRLSCNIRVWLPFILSFSSLKYLILRDEGGRPFPTKPFSFFQLFNLKYLELTNSTTHGSSFPELPLNLKELLVEKHASLEQVPDLSYLKQLRRMYIRRCCSLQSLHKLPPHLLHLTVEDCTSLQDFPDVSMLSDLKKLNVLRNGSNLKVSLEENHLIQLPSLRHLNLEGCKYLKELPHSIAHLTALYHLNLNGCVNLKRLPKPITQLTTLSCLNMRKCSNLKLLPLQLGELKGLQRLDASYTAIEQLPDSIAHLKKLFYLNLRYCTKLRKLPEQFGNIEALETFDAARSGIEQLPDSFSNLLSLNDLDLTGCSKLKRLPEQLGKMQCLEGLVAPYTAIEELPESIGLLPRIKAMNFNECNKLTCIPTGIRNLKSLEFLSLTSREDIKKMELIEAVNDMKLVSLSLSCNIRVWLPFILSFSSLRSLILHDECGSPSPTKPFSFFQLSNLIIFILTDSTSHGSSFPELPLNLTRLFVHNHASLEQVPDLSYLKQLKQMSIRRCCSLQSLHKLPPHLEYLTVEDCTSLQEFPDVSMLSDLKRLSVLRNGSNLKVSLEENHLQLGKFGAILPNPEIAEWFDYKNIGGCTLSFHVPPGDNFVGVALWVIFKSSYQNIFEVVITNKAEDTTTTTLITPRYGGMDVVESAIRCRRAEDFSFKSGDKIMISFEENTFYHTEVKMCGAHILKHHFQKSLPT